MKLDIKIPFTDLARCECHVAASPATAQAVQAQTGADLVVNASIFDLASGEILSRMVSDGKTYGTRAAAAWGIGFPDDGPPVRTWDNGLGCRHYLGPYSYAVVDGQVKDGLRDSAHRGRMLVGLTEDALVVLGFDDADPSRCSTATACQGMLGRGCVFAINLDGGASVQWAASAAGHQAPPLFTSGTADGGSASLARSAAGRLPSAHYTSGTADEGSASLALNCRGQRKVPAFLCIYLKKSQEEEPKLRAIATKKQPVYTASGFEESGRYIDKGDKCELGSITQNLLIPVTYPTSKGPRDAFVRSLEGFTRG